MASVPVGLSSDLKNARVMRAFVDDHDLVVWRSASGKLSAWDNRCPHRGMRLSHGFVRGDALACVYHGWHYDGKGVCRYIPAHPDLVPPDTIKTRIFNAQDYKGLIWVAEQDVPDLSSQNLPALPEKLKPVRTIKFNCKLTNIVALLPGFEVDLYPGGPVTLNLVSEQASLWLVDIPRMSVQLHIGLQKLPDRASQLHILAQDGCANSDLKIVSNIFEEVRLCAETAADEVEVA